MSKTPFQGKPESAIKRADEFIEVDKHDDALEVLFDALRNKRHRDKVNEQGLVITKFCQLCVDHQKTTYAKDGLYQYRVICSQNLILFHGAVKRFLSFAADRLATMHNSLFESRNFQKYVRTDLVDIVPVMQICEFVMSKTPFQGKPESAIKRADEFIEVDKHDDALEVLFDALRNKRHRDKVNEQGLVITKFCQLCVDHQKTTYAKDGLYQYRVICSQNLILFHGAVERFISFAADRLSTMHNSLFESRTFQKYVRTDLVDIVPVMQIDELDVVYTPEDILGQLARSSSIDGKENLSFISFMRFLWDSLRNMLDLCKNNKDHERLYQEIAKRAMDFCQVYRRKAEFRKLCEILRTHLMLIQRHQEQETSVDLTQVDSIQRLMDIRLELIETAIKIDSCQEAFRSLEECHQLIDLSRAARTNPRPQLLAGYFQKQATVYLMANDLIFHAAALTSAFLTYKEDKRFVKKSPDLFKELAAQVILSTLSTPHTFHRDLLFRFVESEESFNENERQLANYLYLTSIPTRYSLLDDIKKYSILDYVSDDIKKLFEIMLQTPLQKLDQKMFTESLEKLKKNHSVYIPYLKNSFAIELIVKLSSFYDIITFNKLHQSIPFLSQEQLETCLISIFKYLHYNIKIDHNTGSIKFPSTISFPITSSYSSDKKDELSNDKLAQLKSIHSLFSQTILDTKQNELTQVYQAMKKHSKNSFVGAEKNLGLYFARRRKELEALQSKEEKRRRILPQQMKRELSANIVNNTPSEPPPKPAEKPPENPEKPTKEPQIEPHKPEHRDLKSMIEKVEVKSKIEEKPKDPNRFKQHEKSLDCLFRVQRAKELEYLTTKQIDRTSEMRERWNRAEGNRVTYARDMFSDKIELKDKVDFMQEDIYSFKDAILVKRNTQMSEDSNKLSDLYEATEAYLLTESKKVRKMKRKQTFNKYQQQQQQQPTTRRPQNPAYQNTPRESPRNYQNTPRESRDQGRNVRPTAESSNAYVPPHMKRGRQGMDQ